MKKYFPYLLLTAAIMLPLLTPGYILTLDLVFTPELRMPAHVGNDYLWYSLLYVLDLALPSQLIEKAILISIPLLSAIGMHRLLEYLFGGHDGMLSGLVRVGSWRLAIYAAALFYTVNPFTYTRFMAGQYAVLLGYALVPFFVRALLLFLASPAWRSLLTVAGIALLISIISIHTLGNLAMISIVLIGIGVWRYRGQTARLTPYIGFGLAGVGLFIAASCYWLIPTILGEGATAQTIRGFDHNHTDAFATAGTTIAGQIANVLQLQGFWLDGRGQYALPQDQLPGWGTVRLLLLALIAYGLVCCWRYARWLGASLVAAGIIVAILAAGIPGSLLTDIGYREPHKFAGLLALIYALGIAVGTARLLHRLRRQHSELGYSAAASCTLLIILLFTPTMYWGFARQLSPRQYPADWYALNTKLRQDIGDAKVLFLPWHQYMGFDFAGRIIANPAEQFFDVPVIASHDPELGTIRPAHDAARRDITALLADDHPAGLGDRLATHNIGYVLLAKEFDHQRYRYLDDLPELRQLWSSPSLTLYRNIAYQEGR